MSASGNSRHEMDLFNSLVMELNMASAQAQLGNINLESGRCNSIASCSSSSCGSYTSNEEFEDFLFAVLHEELAAQAATTQCPHS